MKNIAVIISLLLLVSCSNKEDVMPQVIDNTTAIPFTGNWGRQFEAGPGNLHNVNYVIYQDSIRYTLSGSVGNANYLMIRDYFSLEDNRYIGHTTSNTYYVIFVKNISDNALTIYKQPVTDVAEGLSVEVPMDNNTDNHGWNTYEKQ